MSEPMALTRDEKRELISSKTEKEWYATCDKIKIKRTGDIEGVLNQNTLSIEEGANLKIKAETKSKV